MQGLLALMLLHEARRPARYDAAGDLVLLEDQDRALWDARPIAEGLALVDRRSRGTAPPLRRAGRDRRRCTPADAATDWRQIVGLYAVLMRLAARR